VESRFFRVGAGFARPQYCAQAGEQASEPRPYDEYNKKLQRALTSAVGKTDADSKYFDIHQKLSLNLARFAAAKALHAEHLINNVKTDDDQETHRKKVLAAHDLYLMAETQATAARARTARQWTDFNDTEQKRLFPNVRWLPSASTEQRAEHIPFYNQVWAKDDPFWNSHQPGTLWNCKCDIEETDDDTTGSNVPQTKIDAGKPAPGLGGNPALTGEIFSSDASYFKRLKTVELNKFILDLPLDKSYIAATDGVQFNILRDAKKLSNELTMAVDISKNGYKVLLLPEIYKDDAAQRAKFLPKGYVQRNIKSNPDAVLVKNDKELVADLKFITSPNFLVKRIN
jgi:hypothetical protein